ncbi:hypothetical protein GQ44DRAFT_727814 [Phaeosphaeriaceae sp. PMI808]|nr:hypothetical protein GQ44DRAFT_727814 [Phaeosphaeriaceae sp. PMI808]
MVDRLASAELRTTMVIQPPVKSKKKAKYRPCQRLDGVVVLQRQYRPNASPLPKAFKFEKHIPTFSASATQTKPKEMNRQTRGDCAYVGAHLEEDLWIGHDELLTAGRGGYDGIFNGRKQMFSPCQNNSDPQEGILETPMQRFLSEQGPWNSLDTQED